MRTTAPAGRAADAPAQAPGARRRGRDASRTEAEPAAEALIPPREAVPVPVTTARMLRIDEGLYALRVGELVGAAAEVTGMMVPAAHVSAPFAEDGNAVEIVASFPRSGHWVGREGGTLILRAPSGGGFVVVTAYGAPGQEAADLALQLRRLDGADLPGVPVAGSEVAAAPGPRAAGLTGTRDIAAEILLHIERAGDRVFPGRGWVGALGRRMRIEGFSIRPTEQLAPTDIEMKGYLPNGGETPWVPGGTLCGTRGRGLPLIGFALRIVPQRADRFDVLYQASFFKGGISETHRNASPCRAPGGDDPMEAINVRIVERVAEPHGAAEDGGQPATAG